MTSAIALTVLGVVLALGAVGALVERADDALQLTLAEQGDDQGGDVAEATSQ
jgi:hypothetical protein